MENNLTGDQEIAEAIANKQKRYLQILSIFTYVGAGIGLAFCLMYFIMWSKMDFLLSRGDETSQQLRQKIIASLSYEKWQQMESSGSLLPYYNAMKYAYLLMGSANIFSIIGVLMLQYKKANGFYIYIFSHLLFILAPLALTASYYFSLSEIVFWSCIAIAFVVLYYKSFSELKNG